MKKILSTISLLLLCFLSFGQGITDKSMDKYNVQTKEVLGHTFSVGDTLTFNVGSMPNGEFMSTQLSPMLFYRNRQTPPHLPANYINLRFIIEKIRNISSGLNNSTSLVIYLNKKTPVWIDATIAITKKEILFKKE